MSRIDEALRRAAEQIDDTAPPDVPRPQPTGPLDVAALQDEPYPDEAPAPQFGPPAALPPAEGSAWSAAPAHDAATAVSQEGSTGSSLFERIESALAEKTVVDINMPVLAREQYRRLAAILHDAQGATGLRVVMVASAVPSEGKTLTAANLALTLSESYRRRVLLIDADLRKPTLHQVFRISSVVGLTTGLDPAQPAKLTVHQLSRYLSVLPAGRPTTDPMAGLTSDRMRRLIHEAKGSFDWVIIDTPPLLLLPDAHVLSSMVDGAVLVVRAYSTPHDSVRRASEAIGRTRIVGVVLNQADPPVGGSPDTYYYSYYARKPQPAGDVKPA